MEIRREYEGVWFSADTLEEAIRVVLESVEKVEDVTYQTLRVYHGRDAIRVDTPEEFFAEVRDRADTYEARIWLWPLEPRDQPLKLRSLDILQHAEYASITIDGTDRARIMKVLSVFDRNEATARLPEPAMLAQPPPRIFIGHGRSPDWKELRDHLQDQHGYEVTAYEVGARAGHTIRDILTDMLTETSFALVVMTPEDETAQGKYHPRLNVVHEAGLFQGRLGFSRAIILLKEGTEVFTNIQGLQQIRYSNIRETYGDVLATLRREFNR